MTNENSQTSTNFFRIFFLFGDAVTESVSVALCSVLKVPGRGIDFRAFLRREREGDAGGD